MREPTIRVGIAGLTGVGRHWPALQTIPNVRLVAVADIRKDALAEFGARYGVATYTSVEKMCEAKDIDVIIVSTPNRLHSEHTVMAAENKKHALCEKPMAITLDQCRAMVDAVERNGVRYVQGHSKIFTQPIRKMREIVNSGELGRLIQLNAWYYTSWLQRPRLPWELDSRQGGGLVYRQGPHQTDIVRGIGGGMVRSVRASAGRRDPNFQDTEGHYTAFLEFEDGTPATMVMSGYGHFSITELTYGIGEGGNPMPDSYARGPRRTAPATPEEKYGGRELQGDYGSSRQFPPQYGLNIASCERGDVRQSRDGIYIYAEAGRQGVSCDPSYRREGLDELVDALREDRPTFPDARWGMATVEVCLAILESSRLGREVTLSHQVPCPL